MADESATPSAAGNLPMKSPFAPWPILLLMFLTSLVVALLATRWIGQLVPAESRAIKVASLIGFLGVFVGGYALWMLRFQSLMAAAFGGVLGAFLLRVIRLAWRRVRGASDPFTAAEASAIASSVPGEQDINRRLQQLMARVLRSARIFLFVAIALAPLVFLTGLIAGERATTSATFAAGVLVFGWLLSHLGHRGYLPIAPPDGGNGGAD
jgi:hypothetical protein